jgi:glycine C-acetyltransferase
MESGGEERLALVVEADRALVRTAREAVGGNGKCAAATAELEAIARRVRGEIAESFEVPLHLLALVRPGSFPRTSSGKVQRRACRDALLTDSLEIIHQWRDPLTLPSRLCAEERKRDNPATTASSSPMRQNVRRIVQTWLRSRPGGEAAVRQLRDDDRLTEVGLESVAAANLVLELERATGTRLNPEVVYDYQTIAELATYLDGLARPGANGGARRAAFRKSLVERDRLAVALKERGEYHYETPFETVGPSAVESAGKRMLMLSSYSYLGLLGNPEVNQAAADAIAEFGTGVHGARLVAGTTTLHRRLEESLARLMNSEDAIVYPAGFVTNLATIAAVVGPGDVVIGDEFNHASIADGCRLSGAEFLVFRHNDLRQLEGYLGLTKARNTLVVVDAVYSMEGDVAPIPEISELCRRFGALLMVDEAHSLGVLGKCGRGVQEHFGLRADAIDLKMGALSKCIPSQGGFVAGDVDLISFLRHNARGYMFSSASSPPTIAGALKAIDVLLREPERVERLRRNTSRFVNGIRRLGFRTTATTTAIVPILCADQDQTLRMVTSCRRRGLFVVPIFYPVVPMNAPRIRITLTAGLSDEDIESALVILDKAGREVGIIG